MKRLIKLLIAASLMIAAVEVFAQENCNVVCHNNTVIKVLNDTALAGHIQGHGDIFLGTCDDFTGYIGGACNVLSVKRFEFNKPLPADMIGKKYWLMNLIGQWIQEGIVTENLFDELPKGQKIFIRVKGYKLKYIYIKL